MMPRARFKSGNGLPLKSFCFAAGGSSGEPDYLATGSWHRFPAAKSLPLIQGDEMELSNGG